MTTAVMMSPADVLRGAADWLAEDPARWGQGEFIDHNACRCALGAMAWTLNPMDLSGNPLELSTGNPVLGALGREASGFLASYLIDFHDAVAATFGNDEDQPVETDVMETVANWNDDPARDVGEVVAALRGAAAEFDARRAARQARAS